MHLFFMCGTLLLCVSLSRADCSNLKEGDTKTLDGGKTWLKCINGRLVTIDVCYHDGIAVQIGAEHKWRSRDGGHCICVSANTIECTRNCQVSSWGSWTSCPKTCGTTGCQIKRQQSVTQYQQHGGRSCPSLVETRTQSLARCPINCELSQWSAWSDAPCTDSECTNCHRKRSRTVTRQASGGGQGCGNLSERVNIKCPG